MYISNVGSQGVVINFMYSIVGNTSYRWKLLLGEIPTQNVIGE